MKVNHHAEVNKAVPVLNSSASDTEQSSEFLSDIELGELPQARGSMLATAEPRLPQNFEDDEDRIGPGVCGMAVGASGFILGGLFFAAYKAIGEDVLKDTDTGISMNQLLKAGAVGNAVIGGGLGLLGGASTSRIKYPAHPLAAGCLAAGVALLGSVIQMLTHAAGAGMLNSSGNDDIASILNNSDLWKETATGAAILAGSVGVLIGAVKACANHIDEADL